MFVWEIPSRSAVSDHAMLKDFELQHVYMPKCMQSSHVIG